jgi:D-tagatose-1,6-bisphosphate aldolase subunit GatZ/KbaZ
MQALLDLVREHKAGRPAGIASVCSAHPLVLEAALRAGAAAHRPVLIEATSNQVNQYGGYTGMTPPDFRDFAAGLARRAGLAPELLLLGGDHLGPNCWQDLPAAEAMARAEQLIADYVAAGFRKIHLDCSMSCADDERPLAETEVARRAARLCQVAEQAWARAGGAAPVYVIGTEVPVPGGAHEDLDTLAVTRPEAAAATLEAHRAAYGALGLAATWPRVIALVVQPGVEFDHHKVIDYRPEAARALSRSIESQPGLVFEAHSTDYQAPAALRALVHDHFAVLKVGPGLTFALREALWGLDDIARELDPQRGPGLKRVVLQAMRREPRHWRSYYTDPARQGLDLQFSLSDRIRYYWARPEVASACDALLARLGGRPLPLTLLSQYLPRQFEAVRAGQLENDARALALAGVSQVLVHYAQACGHEPGAS